MLTKTPDFIQKTIRSLFVMAFIILSNFSQAQDFYPEVPLSPDATAFSEYGAVNLGLFTGTFQTSIPLYTYTVGNLSIPISLNYRSNGVKVDDLATTVGLGWMLNAGGAITRHINGLPDATFHDRRPLPSSEIDSEEMENYLKGVSEANLDSQPDIFTFNFLGYQGSFFLDEEGVPSLIDQAQALDIKLETNFYKVHDTQSLKAPSVVITDPQGIKYSFGANYGREMNFIKYDNTPSPPTQYTTVWYLTKIEHPGGEYIDFSYEKGIYRYSSIGTERYYVRLYEQIEFGDSGCSQGSFFEQKFSHQDIRINTAFLHSISGSIGQLSILFDYDKWLEDKQQSSSYYKLTKVSLKNQDVEVKRFELDYNVEESTAHPNQRLNFDQEIDRKRLFLTSVVEKSTKLGKSTSANPYQFTYIQSGELPTRNSMAKDYWGYYNGVDNTNLLYPVRGEDLIYYPNELKSIYEISKSELELAFDRIKTNRNSNSKFAKRGLLKEITYPTGGKQLISYEAHRRYKKSEAKLEPLTRHIQLDAITKAETERSITDVEYLGLIEKGQKVTLNGPSVVNHFEGDYCHNQTTDDIDLNRSKGQASFRVKNLTDDEYVTFYAPSIPNIAQGGSLGDAIQKGVDQPSSSGTYFTLEAGKHYQAEIFTNWVCTGGHASFSYSPYDISTTHINADISNEEVVGGLRVNQVLTIDNHHSPKIYTYEYGEPIFSKVRPSLTFSFYSGNADAKDNKDELKNLCLYGHVSSQNRYPLNNSFGNIGYETVIENFGINAENGRSIHHFEVKEDLPPTNVTGQPMSSTPLVNLHSFSNGRESLTTYEKKVKDGFTPVQEVHKHYTSRSNSSSLIEAYNIVNGYNSNISAPPHINAECLGFDCYNIDKYDIHAQWHIPTSIETTDYFDDGSSKTTIKSFDFSNNVHKQITSESIIDSQGKSRQTKYRYVQDYSNNNSDMAQALETHHMIGVPVETLKYVDDAIVSAQAVEYDFTHNIRPVKIHTVNTESDLSFLESTSIPSFDLYDKDILLTYDEHGNVNTVKKGSNHTTVYLWGYNYSLMIAAISNATYEQVVTALGGKSVYTALQSNTGKELTKVLSKLYNDSSLKNASIELFTHLPGIGVQYMLSSAQLQSEFRYDGLNRLKYALDHNGGVLQKHDYHYKTLHTPSN